MKATPLHPNLKLQPRVSSADIDGCLWQYYGRAGVLQRLLSSLNIIEAGREVGARRSVVMIRPALSSGKRMEERRLAIISATMPVPAPINRKLMHEKTEITKASIPSSMIFLCSFANKAFFKSIRPATSRSPSKRSSSQELSPIPLSQIFCCL